MRILNDPIVRDGTPDISRLNKLIMKKYFLLFMVVLCGATVQAQQNLEIEDGRLILKNHSDTGDVHFIIHGGATLGWAPIDQMLKISPFIGLTNALTIKPSTLGSTVGIGTLARDRDRLLIEHDSEGGGDPSPHLHLLESSSDDFARIKFSAEDEDAFWLHSASADLSSNPRMVMRYHNGTEGKNILTVDGDDLRVGINDGTPEYTLDIHHSTGGPSQNQGLNIRNNGGNGHQWQMYVHNDGAHLYLLKNQNFRGVFDRTSGNYTSVSDARLKQDVLRLKNQIALINQLRPVQYQFKDQTTQGMSYGLIAQDVKKVIPEIVCNLGDDREHDGVLGISYTELIPILIAALQEQQLSIAEQKKDAQRLLGRLQELESRVSALEAR